ncbi:MAG: hypothetical protein MUD01_14970 [Chloroflexaceae bacterium]|jgi:predicted ferric reductase|nr:hypothetical protein [Chloroflexaceae bacterium]
MNYSLAQLLIPFASSNYEPLWVGLGQVAFYLLALVGLSFYARPWIGRRGWRVLHFISFAVFVLVLLHGIASGSDSGTTWVQSAYWFCGGSVLFLTVYRVLVTVRR